MLAVSSPLGIRGPRVGFGGLHKKYSDSRGNTGFNLQICLFSCLFSSFLLDFLYLYIEVWLLKKKVQI
ncbi:hypothetical protein Hanom_Chr05g00460031 [Helianthus anomalus]